MVYNLLLKFNLDGLHTHLIMLVEFNLAEKMIKLYTCSVMKLVFQIY